MTQKSPARPNSDASGKVVVFGVDETWKHWKPRAAWFPDKQAEAVRRAAKQLRLNIIEMTNGLATEIVTKLPAGRIHGNGPGLVPYVREDLYEKLVATINSRGEIGQTPGEVIVKELPGTWDSIQPGHLVLVQQTLVEGWWEAIVVERHGDKLSLRWRDYPGWPRFSAQMNEIALLHPAAAA